MMKMKEDYKVIIEFKNNKTNEISNKEYEFTQYVEQIKFDMMRLIIDLETIFTKINSGNTKDKWSEETLVEFNKLRRKILNQANAINRLPDNLYCKGDKI